MSPECDRDCVQGPVPRATLGSAGMKSTPESRARRLRVAPLRVAPLHALKWGERWSIKDQRTFSGHPRGRIRFRVRLAGMRRGHEKVGFGKGSTGSYSHG
jgi:hypothetical protein